MKTSRTIYLLPQDKGIDERGGEDGLHQNEGLIQSELNIGWASQVALEVKNTRTKAEDVRDKGSGLQKFPGEGNGNPLQYSCLENPMDRGTWWATVHWSAKSWT